MRYLKVIGHWRAFAQSAPVPLPAVRPGAVLMGWVFAMSLISLRAISVPVDWGFEVATQNGAQVASGVDPLGVGWGRGLRNGFRVLRVGSEDAAQFVGGRAIAREITFLDRAGLEQHVAPVIGNELAIALISIALLYAWIAAFVFDWAPDERVGRAFLGFAGVFATSLAAVPFGFISSLPAVLVMGVFFFAVPASIVILSLYFPEPIAKASVLARWTLLITAVLCAANLFYLVDTVGKESFGDLLGSLQFAAMCCGLVLLVSRIIRGARRDAGIPLAVGATLGLGPYLCLTALPELLAGRPLLPSYITGLAVSIIPFTFAYSIVRHRLYGLDVFIRNDLSGFGIITLVPVLFFVLLLAIHASGLAWLPSGAVSAFAVASMVASGASRLRDWAGMRIEKGLDLAGRSSLDVTTPVDVAKVLMDAAGHVLPLKWQLVMLPPELAGSNSGGAPELTRIEWGHGAPDGVAVDAGSEACSTPRWTTIALRHRGEDLGQWLIGPLVDNVPPGRAQRKLLDELGRRASTPLAIAIAQARRERLVAPEQATPESHVYDDRLTPRELQVAALVLEGRSNQQIGAALGIKQGTAAKHIERIMSKLGFQSRAQIAAWAARVEAGKKQDE